MALHRANFSGTGICSHNIPEMHEHLIGVSVATAVDRTPQPPTIPQMVIVAVAGSAVQHGVAVQLQSSPHTAGYLACKNITFRALDEVDLGPKHCFFLPKLDASFLASIDSE